MTSIQRLPTSLPIRSWPPLPQQNHRALPPLSIAPPSRSDRLHRRPSQIHLDRRLSLNPLVPDGRPLAQSPATTVAGKTPSADVTTGTDELAAIQEWEVSTYGGQNTWRQVTHGRGGQAATVVGGKPPSPGPEAAIDVAAELARSGGGVAEPRTATGRGMAAHDDSPRACPLLSSHCGRRPPPTPPTERKEDDDEVRRQIHCRLFLRRLLFHRRCLLFSPGRRRCAVDLA
uniref:Uncharacterized protein n=1 Tax=Oryza glumipatula TaxID=40148 RepID=A0A0D9Z1Q9_9ORYZ